MDTLWWVLGIIVALVGLYNLRFVGKCLLILAGYCVVIKIVGRE